MLGFMTGMYFDKGKNAAIFAGSAIVFLVSVPGPKPASRELCCVDDDDDSAPLHLPRQSRL
jgi:hypothetical protein